MNLKPLFVFLGQWALNGIFIWLFGNLVPKNVVLGNQHVLPIWASVFPGFVMTTVQLLTEHVLSFMTERQVTYQKLTLAFVVNAIAVWSITRFALMLGVGVSAFWWAGILAAALTLGQWAIILFASKKK